MHADDIWDVDGAIFHVFSDHLALFVMSMVSTLEATQFYWGVQIHELFKYINDAALQELYELIPGYHEGCGGGKVMTHNTMYTAIAAADNSTQYQLALIVLQIIKQNDTKRCTLRWIQKRQRDKQDVDLLSRNVKKARVEEILQPRESGTLSLIEHCRRKFDILVENADVDADVVKVLQSDFMKLPDTAMTNDLVKKFILRTGNEAMKTFVCTSCATEVELNNVVKLLLQDIPNKHNLYPEEQHVEHDIFEGMLLEPEGLCMDQCAGFFCQECLNNLEQNR